MRYRTTIGGEVTYHATPKETYEAVAHAKAYRPHRQAYAEVLHPGGWKNTPLEGLLMEQVAFSQPTPSPSLQGDLTPSEVKELFNLWWPKHAYDGPLREAGILVAETTRLFRGIKGLSTKDRLWFKQQIDQKILEDSQKAQNLSQRLRQLVDLIPTKTPEGAKPLKQTHLPREAP